MKITFPHLGYCWIPLKALFEALGHQVIVPPPITRRTINLGTLHGPEFACYPLKLGLGNFIEALEQGAETLVMGGGIGPCRFGYYAQVQQDILRALGYDFRMVVVEPPLGHARQVVQAARELKGKASWWQLVRAGRLALAKLAACDAIHRHSLIWRPRAADKEALNRLYRQGMDGVDKADTLAAARAVARETCRQMEGLTCSNPHPPRVALVGEVYLLAEPAANLNIEEKLGLLGVEAVRHVWISTWLQVNIFWDFLRLRRRERAENVARPWLNCFVGGHGQHSVGETVQAAREGLDGVIHVYPFTCTPEIVARGIMQNIAGREGLPMVCFSLDEHSGEGGFNTRLEAFCDIVHNQSRELKNHGC